jgi:CheY-like chemotaxis protein
MAHLLLVDDHPDLSEVVVELLQAHGHTVEMCGDAEAALSVLRDHRPDAVVVDQRLPGMTGIELVQRIRSNPKIAAVPVILCSADDTIAAEARAAGAQDFWLKGSDKLFDRVAQLAEILGALANGSSGHARPAQPASNA